MAEGEGVEREGGGVRKILSFALAFSATTPVAALAQVTDSSVSTPAIDPGRLAVARGLVDQIFPPATRSQMMQGMMASMNANIRQSFMSNPQFAAAIGSDPRVKAIFDKFMDRQFTRTTEALNANLPGMSTAMARAYARRFDLAQLHDLTIFFATPTGRAYTATAMTIMSDPDIAAWQRDLMAKTMGHVQADVADLTREVLALKPPVEKP